MMAARVRGEAAAPLAALARAPLVALLTLAAAVACDRAATADPGEPDRAAAAGADAAGEIPAGLPPHDPRSAEELLLTHPVTDEGAACATDRECDSPLRCTNQICAWPVAMTGETDGTTPMVIFAGERMEVRYFIEVASEPWEVSRGLMHRRSMVGDFGMLFVFESDEERSFWMRNTLIPLDMIFVTDAGLVDSFVENAEPLTESRRVSDGPARFVIELNAGEVARMGLAAGSRVELLNLPPELMPRGL